MRLTGLPAYCRMLGGRTGIVGKRLLSAVARITSISIVLLAGPSGCQKSSAQKASEPPPVPVEVVAAEIRTMPIEMQAIGTGVEPVASGTASNRRFRERFCASALPTARRCKRATRCLKSMRVPLMSPSNGRKPISRPHAPAAVNANEQAERYTTLIERRVASKEQFSQFLSTAESQKAVSDSRQADVDEAQLSLDWTQVRAPISGRAGAALLKAGNIVNANSDVLTIINQMKPIYVAFSLQEGALAEVRKSMEKSKPTVRAYDPDSGHLLGTGELSFVDNSVDRVSGMIAFKATFPNQEDTLWPGQFVDVTVKLGDEQDALLVPTAAIMEGQGARKYWSLLKTKPLSARCKSVARCKIKL